MSQWKVYAYDKCDTCRKALKFLDRKGVRYEKIDITQTPPTDGELKQMLTAVGDLKKLFNTSGVAYREGKISEKLPKLGETETLRLLASNGRLVKRPFALFPGGGLVGFREAEWEKAIG